MIITDKKLLAEALRWKGQEKHAKDPEFRYQGFTYDYDKDIFPSVRITFPEYDKLYHTNEELTKYFARDLNNKNPRLLEEINEKEIPVEQAPAEESTEAAAPAASAGGESPITMVGGSHVAVHSPIIISPKAETEAKTLSPKTSTRRPLPNIKIPSAASNIASGVRSSSGIFIQGLSARFPKSLSGFLGGVSGGGIRTLGGLGLKTMDATIGFTERAATRGLFKGSLSKKVWIPIVSIFFGGVFGLGFLSFLFPEQTPTVAALPLTPVTTNIASCQFTRSDQTPQSATFKSQALLNYFQEASAKSGIPTAVLAGIARIESPSITSKTDDNLSSYGCPESETGAKGLMQIQPPGTTGTSAPGISLGAQYLGIPIENLNYCDLRQSIFLGAGVINAKRGGSWDASKTNDKSYIDSVAESYYGCLRYGGPKGTKCDDPQRIYSYGDDLYKSINECRSTPPPAISAVASCPVPGGAITNYSYQYASTHPGTPGHCFGGYGYSCNCGANGRRAKAIDVTTNGKDVLLPMVEDKKVNWTYIQTACAGNGTFPSCTDLPDATGALLTFRGTSPALPDTWYIQFVHIDIGKIFVKETETYQSGTAVGKVDYTNHVHSTIGKNIQNPLNSGTCTNGDPNNCPTDCDPGWLSSDFMCK